MPIPEPSFDTRTYRQILNEALARIPVHNPEWTNFNDSDPGVTLLQVFAFMSETILYRANRIPQRNRRKFLRLLGLPVRAAEAARGFVVFDAGRGPLQAVTLDAGQEVLAGRVPFRTTNGLQVLPIQARAYYKRELPTLESTAAEAQYRRLYASFAREPRNLAFYETSNFAVTDAGAPLPALDLANDTIDGTLWLALLARPNEDPNLVRRAIAGQVLTLGLLPAPGEQGRVLAPGSDVGAEQLSLMFEVPNTDTDEARWRLLPARTSADLLAEPGLVELVLPAERELRFWSLDPLEAGTGRYPPSLEDTDDQERLITWIRIRAAQGDDPATRQVAARLSWVGINAAQIVQRAVVPAERLPDGTGEPDQVARLINTPVIEDSVSLTVGGERWYPIDDLTAAPAEDAGSAARRYTIDRQSGEIRFGNGAHGARPPRGVVIQVAYAYGGGSEGMVGAGAINKAPRLPTGMIVTNPVPTFGGDPGETLEQAEQRIPAFIKHRDRLVSEKDFHEIAERTPGVILGRIEVLPLFHPAQREQQLPGVVTVMVVPRTDPVQPEAPVPDRAVLDAVCRYLAPRRIITTELHVRGPEYEDLWVSAGINVVPGRDSGPVRDRVARAISAFLSALTGGFDGRGWPLDKAVEAAELAAVATRVDGVASVVELILANRDGAEVPQIGLRGLELPRLRAVEVAVGRPVPIAQLRGEVGETPVREDAEVVPVPVVPQTC